MNIYLRIYKKKNSNHLGRVKRYYLKPVNISPCLFRSNHCLDINPQI